MPSQALTLVQGTLDLLLLKILALGRRQVEQGRVIPVKEAFRRARAKLARR